MIDHNQAGKILSEMVQIGRTFRVAGQHSREQSLTGTKYGFLQALSRSDARLGELATHLSVSAPVASRAADSLEAEGLVERRGDPRDARASLISITELGREKVSENDEHVVARFADALTDWSREDAERALSILQRVREHLKEVLDAPDIPDPVPGKAPQGGQN